MSEKHDTGMAIVGAFMMVVMALVASGLAALVVLAWRFALA